LAWLRTGAPPSNHAACGTEALTAPQSPRKQQREKKPSRRVAVIIEHRQRSNLQHVDILSRLHVYTQDDYLHLPFATTNINTEDARLVRDYAARRAHDGGPWSQHVTSLSLYFDSARLKK
jgi:hypothetical protein